MTTDEIKSIVHAVCRNSAIATWRALTRRCQDRRVDLTSFGIDEDRKEMRKCEQLSSTSDVGAKCGAGKKLHESTGVPAIAPRLQSHGQAGLKRGSARRIVNLLGIGNAAIDADHVFNDICGLLKYFCASRWAAARRPGPAFCIAAPSCVLRNKASTAARCSLRKMAPFMRS
jgi:hypothetical protein